MPLVIGSRLGPYEILALIGQGGMGEVYRAIDTRVGRSVAVKVLPADAASQPERRQRFEREARAVARLNHPNICTLFDVGQHDGIEFLVMEYLEGETLASRLARGSLPIPDAIKHAIALAEALASAHREGITHRDLKPSNVMLTASSVKLLDFGLAKLREHSDDHTPRPTGDADTTAEAVSPEGTLVGTIAYMSPEQIAGKPVDARTDIYALGLILYEMITGQRAFAKQSQAGLMAAILTEDPPPMTMRQPATPSSIERIVRIALAKQPDARWQSAGDLARELAWAGTGSDTTTADTTRALVPAAVRKWWAPVAAVVAIVAALAAPALLRNRRPPIDLRSVVILPCRAGADPMTQAYCDGLTDTLSARLTPLALAGGTQVTSTLEVRQRGVRDASGARRDFGATLVLEGGILRVGESLRVNYVLIDAATLKQIDAFSATLPAGDPFALQDRVATWAATVLELKLGAGGRETLTARGTQAAGALELYLQGHGYLLEFQKPGNVDLAIDLFSRAIALDSRYAMAHADLGRAFWRKYEATRDAAWVPKARDACMRATTLDSALSTSHLCQGTIAFGTGQLEEAAREFQLVIDREPMNDEGTLGLARAQARNGATAEAEATYTRAITLRPQYWATHVWLGTFYREHGRYADAAQRYELALQLTPDNARIYYILGGLYGSIGRYDEAIAACRKSVALVPSVSGYMNWGATLANLRRFDEAIAKFQEARRLGPENYRIDGNLARAYYFGGKQDQAMAEYGRAIELAAQALDIDPKDTDARISLAAFYAKTGDRSRAYAQLGLLPPDVTDPHVLVFGAVVQTDLADEAGALAWLERAATQGLVRTELHDWIELDALKGNPRFNALLVK